MSLLYHIAHHLRETEAVERQPAMLEHGDELATRPSLRVEEGEGGDKECMKPPDKARPL